MAIADGLNYDDVRHQQVTASYMETLKHFLADFDANKKSVVIVPGIMGSKLRISNSNFDNLDAGFDPTHYRDIWSLNAATYRESYKLAIDENGHDYQDHVIVQDGSIDGVLLGIVKVRPYNNAVQFFKDHSKNCMLFGYDWRWSPSDLAHYLGEFLRAMAAQCYFFALVRSRRDNAISFTRLKSSARVASVTVLRPHNTNPAAVKDDPMAAKTQ